MPSWKKLISSGSNAHLNAVTASSDIVISPTKKLYLDGGSNTYIFEESADNVIHYVGGQNKLRFNSTGTILNDAGLALDFRVEGDTEPNLLFVDGSADRVGIGTNLPNTLLHLYSTSNTQLRLQTTGTGNSSNIIYQNGTASYSVGINSAEQFSFYSSQLGDDAGFINTNGWLYWKNNIVLTNNNTPLNGRDTGGTVRTMLKIDANNDLVIGDSNLNDVYINQNVGIGTSGPGEKLHVNGSIEFAGRKYNRGSVSVAGAGTANGQAITLSTELGTTLSVNYQYKITLSTTGTGTDTGAVYILTYDQDGGAWDLRLVSRAGSTSNHPLAVVDGSNLKAYHNHASTYNILYFVEFWDMSADDGTLHGWGSDYQWQRDVDKLYYNDGNVGIGTSSPSHELEVAGTGSFAGIVVGGGTFTSASLAAGGSGGGSSDITMDGSTANGLLTFGGTDNIDVESNLTFDGTNLDLPDSKKIRLGTSQDLEIYHDGTNSVINNAQTGNLQIYNNVDNGMIELLTDNGSGGTQVFLRADGANNMVRLPVDGVKLTIGDASDLQFYHTGNTNYIRANTTDQDLNFLVNDGGSTTTALQIDASNVGRVVLPNDNQHLAIGADLDLRLYNNGSASYIANQNQTFYLNQTAAAALYLRNTSSDQDIYISVNDGGSQINAIQIDASNVGRVILPNDGQKLAIGASEDLSLHHTSDNSFIANTTTGDLYIQNSVDDKDIIFRTDDGAGGVTPYLTLDGGLGYMTAQKHMNFIDNQHVVLGTGNDLRIYHDSGDSINYIESSTSDMDIKIKVNDGGSTITALQIDSSNTGAVRLPNDGQQLLIGANDDLRLQHNGNHSFIQQYGTGDLYIDNTIDDKSIYFRTDDGSGGVTTYLQIRGDEGQMRASKQLRMQDNVQLQVGSSGDAQFFHNTADTYLQNTTGHLYIQNTADDRDIIVSSDDGSGGITPYITLDGSTGELLLTPPTRTEIQGNLVVEGDLTAQNYIVSSSITYMTQSFSSGSTIFGDSTDDTHQFTGSLNANSSTGSFGELRLPPTGKLIFDQSGTDGSGTYIAESVNDVVDHYVGGTNLLRLEESGTDYVQVFDNTRLSVGTGKDLQLYHAGNVNYIRTITQDQDLHINVNDGGSTITAIQIDSSNVGRVKLPNDNQRLTIGAGDDLHLFHDGSNTGIENYVGDLIITNNADDKDIIFKSDDGSGGTTAYLTLDGSAGNLNFNNKALVALGGIYGNGGNITLYNNTYNFKSATSVDLMKLTTTGLGIGTTSPQEKLDVASGSAHIRGVDSEGYVLGLGQASYDGTVPLFKISTFDDTSGGTSGLTAGDHLEIYGARWGFQNTWARGGQGGAVPVASLYSSAGESRFSIYEALNPSSDATYSERIRLRGNGDSWITNKLGIGTTSPDTTLDVFSSGVNGILLNQQTSDSNTSARLMFKQDDTTWTMYGAGGNLEFRSGGTVGSSSGTAQFRITQASGVRIPNDNDTLALGAGEDLYMYHDGTDSLIRNQTGGLYIDQLTDDGDLVLRCDNGSGGTTAYLTLDGSATQTLFHQDTRLQVDNKSLSVGANNDLRMIHATHSYLQNTSTSMLVIQNTGVDQDIAFMANDNGSNNHVMRIKGATGFVGIGTTSPTKELEIEGSNPTLSITNTATSAGSGPTLEFGHDQGGGSRAGAISTYLTDGSTSNRTALLRFWHTHANADVLKLQIGDNYVRQYQKSDTSDYLETLVNDDHVEFHVASGNYVKISTDSGYLNIGPQNASWNHFYTDRPGNYFNKKVTIDTGILESYDEDLQLRRAQGTADRIDISADYSRIIVNNSERFRATTSGATVTGDLTVTEGITSDGNAKSYTWRAVNNTSSTSTTWVKIATVTGTQSTRFSIHLSGRTTSYTDGVLGAYGYIIGQLNNDDNYDLLYYNHSNASSQVVQEVAQVDVSGTATDVYIKVGTFAEVVATAVISDGSIDVRSDSVTSQPANYVVASTIESWNSGNDGASSGLDADTLDGSHASAFLTTSGTAANSQLLDSIDSTGFTRKGVQSGTPNTASSRTTFTCNDAIETSSGNQSGLEVWQDTAGADAFMTFHVAGDYAGYFGLDGAINDLSWGGWSNGNGNKYRVFHAGNSTNIVSLGTITTGTWNGSVIASAYLDADTAHLSGTQTFTGAKTFGTQTWNGHITWNSSININVAGESSFDVSGGGVWQVWDSGTGAPFIMCDVGQQTEIGSAGSRGLKVHGNSFINGQLQGGFGAQTTGGTTDWNHSTNARSGNGHTLLLSTATNGPGTTTVNDLNNQYYHLLNFEYAGYDNDGNMTQIGIPYSISSNPVRPVFRTRYNGTWSSYRGLVTANANGQIQAGPGTAALPSITFNGGGETDTDTGILRTAANTIGFSTGGSTRFTMNNSGVFYASSAIQAGNAGIQIWDATHGFRTVLAKDSTYTKLLNNDGAVCAYFGDSGDGSNYFDNGNHRFRSSGGGTYFGILNSTGLRIGTGATFASYRLDVVGDARISSGALGVGVNPNAQDGRIDAGNDVVAFSSDKRLKQNIRFIENPLEKISQLSGFVYNWNELANKEAGYDMDKDYVGVFAQDVEKVQPEAVKIAPFDNDGEDNSKSGENYLTVQYEKMVPLLIESIKELKSIVETQNTTIEQQQQRLTKLEEKSNG